MRPGGKEPRQEWRGFFLWEYETFSYTLHLVVVAEADNNPGSEESAAILREWVGWLSMDITKGTSPELAIKIAYDFGRGLRLHGPKGEVFEELLAERVERPFGENSLLPYIRAGFTAGFNYLPLPGRRQIEADGANKVSPPPAGLRN